MFQTTIRTLMLSILASRSGERYEASFADHRWKRVEVARRFPEVR